MEVDHFEARQGVSFGHDSFYLLLDKPEIAFEVDVLNPAVVVVAGDVRPLVLIVVSDQITVSRFHINNYKVLGKSESKN